MRNLLAIGAVLVVVLGASPVWAAEMQAGTAKGVITNEEPMVMVNGRVSEGTLADIHARVLTLYDGKERLVIVTYDLNCLDVATPYLRARCRDELGIPISHLIPLATHNHNAPIQIVPDNFEYGRWLAGKIFDLIAEAIANERGPVSVEFGHGNGYFIRATGNAPADYEIQVLRVLHEEAPLAILFNHGAHPMQASVSKIDPGHPGFAMDNVEERFPGALALYADAVGGNQFVRVPRELNRELADARRKGPEYADPIMEAHARQLGHELAQSVFAILEGPMTDVTGPIQSGYARVSLPLAPPMSKEDALELAEKQNIPLDIGFVPYPHPDRRTNWVRMLLRHYEKGLPFPTELNEYVCTDDTYMVMKIDEELLDTYAYSIHDELPCEYQEVITARIGPMAFVAMQGEVCAPIGMRIKDHFRYDMPVMLFAYMGEHNLYIPTREIVRLNAYQAQTLQIQYASPVGWAPEVEDDMVQFVIDQIAATLDD